MSAHEPSASRRSSRSARACGALLWRLLLKEIGRRVRPCGTITGNPSCPDDFQQELAFWASSSPASREPPGNGCAERFIRTLKENLLRLRPSDTDVDLRQALLDFGRLRRDLEHIERHGSQTPAAVRQNQLSTAARAA